MAEQVILEEAGRRLDAYLDAVEAALSRGGTPREGRRAIVDDLEAQLREMLWTRTGGGEATIDDVERLLAEVDPPSAYEGGEGTGPARAGGVARGAGGRGGRGAGVESAQGRRGATMKTWILVALIVCGTVLVTVPAVSDWLNQRVFAETVRARAGAVEGFGVTVPDGRLTGLERFAFWVAGGVMIATAMAVGLTDRAKGVTPLPKRVGRAITGP